MKEAVDLKQVVTFSQTMFRGHVHIHVATHNVKSTLWVGGWVFTSTPRRYLVESRGNLTIFIHPNRPKFKYVMFAVQLCL
jgi:hypothetical protein